MSSVKKFQHDLGRELVGAAHRQAAAANEQRRAPSPLKMLPIIGIAAVLLIAAITVIDLPGPLGTPDAVADTFVITQLDDRIELEVVDIITDPDDVLTQLQDELGLQAEIFAVAADPQLIGQISAIGTTGDIAPQMVFNNNGTVTKVVLPIGFQESLIIQYGRAAEPAEPYIMTVTNPICANYFGQTFTTTGTEINRLADLVRYETIDPDGILTPEAPINDIPANYVLIDIAALSDNSYIVGYAANTTSRPIHPNCQ